MKIMIKHNVLVFQYFLQKQGIKIQESWFSSMKRPISSSWWKNWGKKPQLQFEPTALKFLNVVLKLESSCWNFVNYLTGYKFEIYVLVDVKVSYSFTKHCFYTNFREIIKFLFQELESSSLELILYNMLAFTGSKFSLVDTKYSHPIIWSEVGRISFRKGRTVDGLLFSKVKKFTR